LTQVPVDHDPGHASVGHLDPVDDDAVLERHVLQRGDSAADDLLFGWDGNDTDPEIGRRGDRGHL